MKCLGRTVVIIKMAGDILVIHFGRIVSSTLLRGRSAFYIVFGENVHNFIDFIVSKSLAIITVDQIY